jgi:Fe-S cluster assembly scaffold protein SufB
MINEIVMGVARDKDQIDQIKDMEKTIESQTEDHSEMKKGLRSHKDKEQNYFYMVIKKNFMRMS